MARKVDSAMGQQRPEKVTIREYWGDAVATAEQLRSSADVPLYLTLSGADGGDIEVMENRGIIRRTQVNSLRVDDQEKIIAVENNSLAVLALQKKFPGLKILESPVENLLRSTNLITWPDGVDRDYCRAVVVNLDLNQPLKVEEVQGQITFPVLALVRKLCQLHAIAPRVDWCLCLTLHGEITWSEKATASVQAFLAENFKREQAFADACEQLLGTRLFDLIAAGSVTDMAALRRPEQQSILMVVVPKKIAQMVHDQGWLVKTTKNLRYGGVSGRAPMVSWIINFEWDGRASITPDLVYRESLRDVLTHAHQILADGSIAPASAVAA